MAKSIKLKNSFYWHPSSIKGGVNNAKLTIQKNGTIIKEFTANASSDVVANISVPTKTSELTNNSGYITNSNLPSTITGDNVVNRTSGGTITSSSYRRYGNVVELFVGINTTSSTTVGSDCFKGSLNNNNLKPPLGATTVNYNGSSVIIGSISDTGEITVRICGATLASGKGFGLRFTYVI